MMTWRFAYLLGLLGCLSSTAARGADEQTGTKTVASKSPAGGVSLEVFLEASATGRSVPHYKVTFKGHPIIEASPLRVELADGSALGEDCSVDATQTSSIDATFHQHPGKRSTIVDRCSQIVITYSERGKLPRTWQLVVRVYDDGVALRYRFPRQDGWTSLVLSGERTAFKLPAGTLGYALALNSFTTSYEKRYVKTPIVDVPANWLLGLPLLLQLPGTGWAAITEANLTDYAGMYLARDPGQSGVLVSRLAPLPKESAVAVRSTLPHDSPWRVIMVADDPGRFIESDLLLKLNDPCEFADVSWIRSGKTTFPWWNGYFEQNVPFKPGLNTATVKYYIDFCARAGIPYHSLDGVGNTAWYGGPIVPYEGADPTKGIDGLDLPEVLRYAAAKGVRLRLWMHWQAAQAHMARSFPRYHEWGIEGVMVDFMDRDDQEMVNFLRDVLRTAAANQLTVTFHGVAKPTGLERTYPNVLTNEGVLNLEHDKWDPIGVTPEHELTVVFTRMLAGPLDFHQGSLRGVAVAEFKPQNDAPLVMGTPCRTLASYVVLQNHLSMVADYPSAYRDHPALPVLAAIPTTWDDTKVLSGAVGEWVAIARRHGDQWWVGAMTDRTSRELPVRLDFLGPGRYRAEIYRDDLAAKYGLATETRDVTARDIILTTLAPAGGLLLRLSPLDRNSVGSTPRRTRSPVLRHSR
jgi:alpha-glucosidase